MSCEQPERYVLPRYFTWVGVTPDVTECGVSEQHGSSIEGRYPHVLADRLERRPGLEHYGVNRSSGGKLKCVTLKEAIQVLMDEEFFSALRFGI